MVIKALGSLVLGQNPVPEIVLSVEKEFQDQVSGLKAIPVNEFAFRPGRGIRQ